MHHMDSFSIWGNSPNKLTIDPDKLERLDFFIDQLRKRGVYTNLNLHVLRGWAIRKAFPDAHSGPITTRGSTTSNRA